MPILEYRCSDCGYNYEIFHKVRELLEEIECPSCQSHNYKRLMSAPSINSGIKSVKVNPAPACQYANTGSCSGDCEMFK